MGGVILDFMHRADAWLREHIRFYSMLLGAGLVLSMSDTIHKLTHAFSDHAVHDVRDVLGTAFLLVFQGALLINQLAQWQDYRLRKRERRARKGAGVTTR